MNRPSPLTSVFLHVHLPLCVLRSENLATAKSARAIFAPSPTWSPATRRWGQTTKAKKKTWNLTCLCLGAMFAFTEGRVHKLSARLVHHSEDLQGGYSRVSHSNAFHIQASVSAACAGVDLVWFQRRTRACVVSRRVASLLVLLPRCLAAFLFGDLVCRWRRTPRTPLSTSCPSRPK